MTETGKLELLELLAQKCDEWTRGESSSLPAEKAQDILTSILYVISLARKEPQDTISVSELFERGLVCVQKSFFPATCSRDAY